MALLRVDYSSSALKEGDYKDKLEAARVFCAAQGWTLGVQIHNSTAKKEIKKLAATGVPLSWHAPVCSDYIMNLAAAVDAPAEESRQKTLKVIRTYGGEVAVFHGFLMTDKPVYSFNEKRSWAKCMKPIQREELCREGTPLCNDFFGRAEFATRLERVRERLARWNQEDSPFVWAIENDCPYLGAGMLLSEHLAAVAATLCLDVSHLWVAALLYGRDFHREVEAIAATGRIACVHLHANPLIAAAPLSQYRDGHCPLHTPTEMDLPRVVRRLRDGGVMHYVIETEDASLADLRLLADWLA